MEEEKSTTKELKKIPKTLWDFVISIFSFKQDEDVNPIEVSEAIERSVEFKGYNVWVLICSIFIASVGLNMDSIAVIIGAMLISPLMGPIRGIGLAVGTNNFKLLLFSLINLGIATGVSVLVSFIYFKVTPFKDPNISILSRTEPNILDVLIASFGGLAGIIAASKNDNSTVVPGVAIATALMPPLCVTGYSLAVGNLEYFLGAFYLFLLNSIFICLTTVLVIRYLRFPLASYVNKKKERRIKMYIAIFLILILVPSGFKFVEIWKKSAFNAGIEHFITSEIVPIGEASNFSVINKNILYTEDKQLLTLSIMGSGRIGETRLVELKNTLQKTLPNCDIKINQNAIDQDLITPEYFNDVVANYTKIVAEKNKKLEDLQKEINANFSLAIDMPKTEKRLKFQEEFSRLKNFTVGNTYQLNMNSKVDTILLFRAIWNDTALIKERTNKLHQFIKMEFEPPKYQLIEEISSK